MKLPLMAMAAIALAAAATAFGQHVTIGAPAALPSDATAGALPSIAKSPSLEYPEDMRSNSTVGYAILLVGLGNDGAHPVLRCFGSHVPFQQTVVETFHLWRFNAAPPTGQGGVHGIWIPVIFNPKSANPKAREATPQLLAVAPAFTRERPAVAPGLPPAVPVKLRLDATGAISAVEPQLRITSNLRDSIDAALRDWRFAPARHEGNPVATEITVPVVCVPPGMPSPPAGTPAKAISQTAPEYPMVMRRFGLEGRVDLDFDVMPDGSVQNPVVHSSNNPEFDAPAMVALRKWKFAPGMRDGKPTKTHMRVPIIFQLGEGGRDAFTVETQRDQSKLPPEMRYDTPPKIRNVQIPVYPYSLLKAGVDGKAQVVMLIDRRGKVTQVKVTSADRPEFGLALAAAVEGFEFEPALKDGVPVPFLLKFEQDFSRFTLRDESADDLLALEKKHPDRIASATQLDMPPKPVSQRPPITPTGPAGPQDDAEALIECIVDVEGHARLPRIVTATAPAYGYAAMQAANGWWFEPAQRAGKAVPVRVQIPFRFTTKKVPVRNPK
jgi:TonB family protein